MVEEELEFPLENGYTLFEEVYDSTALEPTHEYFFAFLIEAHNPTSMDPSHDKKISLYDNLGDLFISPTSYTSKFCSIYPNEVWVKGFFFMAPCDEYETPISPFDDDMTREPSYLHLQ